MVLGLVSATIAHLGVFFFATAIQKNSQLMIVIRLIFALGREGIHKCSEEVEMRRKPQLSSLTLNLVLTLGVLGMNTPLWARQGEPGLTLTLKVYNYAPTTEETLIQAEKTVKRIFRKLGVDIAWLEVSVPSQEKKAVDRNTDRLRQDPSPQLRILLFPRSMAERLGRSKDALGYAAPALEGQPTNLAYVFHHRVNQLVQDLLRAGSFGMPNRAQILAHAMAHEIGHLLLPFDADSLHSPTGIMRAAWDPKDLRSLSRGQLTFTPEQAARIRGELMRRTMEQKSKMGESG